MVSNRIQKIRLQNGANLRTAAERNLFGGGIVKHHKTKRQKVERLEQQLWRRYTEVISFRFLGSCKELRWAEPCKSSLPPCDLKVEKKQKLLVTEVDTHTHSATCARSVLPAGSAAHNSALGCVYAKARSPAHTGVLKQLGICKRKLSAAGAGTRSGWCFQSQNHVFIVQLAKYSAYFTVVLQSRQFSFSSSPDTQQREMTHQREMTQQ